MVKLGKVRKAKEYKPRHIYKCARCDAIFSTRIKLKNHSKTHLKSLEEIKLLQQGHIPQESKIGEKFRGKNKVIIS